MALKSGGRFFGGNSCQTAALSALSAVGGIVLPDVDSFFSPFSFRLKDQGDLHESVCVGGAILLRAPPRWKRSGGHLPPMSCPRKPSAEGLPLLKESEVSGS